MVTWQYSQKNDGHPPANAQIRPNQRFAKCDVKIGRCEWLWKLTPTFMPEIQPSIVADAATKAMRDHGPVTPTSLGWPYSQKAQQYAARQAMWKTTQCASWGSDRTRQRLSAAGASRSARFTTTSKLQSPPVPGSPSSPKGPKASRLR